MKKVLIFLILAASICLTIGFDFCHTSECKSERRNAWLAKNYEKAISHYTELIQNSTCSVCNIDGLVPCHNNGTCIVTGNLNYTCDCPDNTVGDACETILSCQDDNPCGTNAICTVAHHKKNCNCPPGYTGDPKVNCDLMVKQACLVADPHFTTFDGASFNYQGTCPYYVMKACDASIDFSITATNFYLNSGGEANHVTSNRDFTFHTQKHEFRVDENLNFWIDGVITMFNKNWPDDDNPTIIISKPSGDVVQIQDLITQAVITYTITPGNEGGTHNLCIKVPLTSFFYGPNTMCGVFGSIDNNCMNDIQYSNGTVYPTNWNRNCTYGSDLEIIAVHDTWVANSTVDNCIEGAVMTNNTNCNISTAQTQCGLIRQAIDGQGPFGACQALGHDVVDKWYHDCTHDICNGKAQCDMLDIFAKSCLQYLPFANLDSWRTADFCPYTCPPNSHYSLKTSTCQDACFDPNQSNSSTCHEAYVESCACDFGYYYDPNGQLDGYPFVCRKLEDCGCLESNGSYILPNTKTLNSDCSVETDCTDGELTTKDVSCSANGQCNLISGFYTCQCKHGYSGDGFACSDINECLDPNTCNNGIGQGICTNLPGTYNCTCIAPYSGPECTDYTPSRHCADLKLFHGADTSGVYSISIGATYDPPVTNANLTWIDVYCDMDEGWTLMGHGNNTGNKAFTEYAIGFGDPASQNVWLGLENIHKMTQSPTSLRIVVESCPFDNLPVEDCTYSYFSITDSSQQYAIFLNSTCQNSINVTKSDWVAWDKTQLGPVFSAFDMDNSNNCSSAYDNTGWWFYSPNKNNHCGFANLNGLRYICSDEDDSDKATEYLTWRYSAAKDAHMWLRPRDYPTYDPKYSPPTEPVVTEAPNEVSTASA